MSRQLQHQRLGKAFGQVGHKPWLDDRRPAVSPAGPGRLGFALQTVIWLWLFTGASSAQTLEEQERANTLDKIEQLKRDAFANVDAMVADKKAQCLSAVGNKAMCECLSVKLPVIVNFVVYVATVAKRKDELKYDTLKPEEQQLIDTIRRARDQCVPQPVRSPQNIKPKS
jgi:hypothetical protein